MTIKDRFTRTRLILGQDNLDKLHNSFAVVVGLGAVGSYAVEALARAGVGKLRLVDFDTVCATNINRQLFALESTIGKAKTDLAKARILDINPDCKVETLNCFVHVDTIPDVLEGNPDIIIDAIDALNPKIELIGAAQEYEIPIISSMGAALRTDPSKIQVDKMKKVKHCPLARQMRKRLRRRKLHLDFQAVFSLEHSNRHGLGELEDVSKNLQRGESRGRARNLMGSLPTITGIFGLTAANAAIKTLTENR